MLFIVFPTFYIIINTNKTGTAMKSISNESIKSDFYCFPYFYELLYNLRIKVRCNVNSRKLQNCRQNPFCLFFSILLLINTFHLPSDINKRIVNIGIYENSPKVFISESGKPAGIFIDIIKYIAEKEGWELNFVSGTWGEGLDRLEKGEIDLMPDVAKTANREEIFSFHEIPVLSSWFQVYTKKGNKIQSILDLDGKRIAVLERSVQEESFNALAKGLELNVTILPLPDYKKCFDIVLSGEADAAITNRFYGLTHAGKSGLKDTAVIFNPTTLFFAASKYSDRTLLETIDRHLSALKKDTHSVYYTSLKQWISEESVSNFPQWLKLIFVLVLLLLLISLTGSVILKYQVNIRTEELSRNNEQMHIMEKTLRLTATKPEMQEILNNFLLGALKLTKIKSGTLYLTDYKTERLVKSASVNVPDDASFSCLHNLSEINSSSFMSKSFKNNSPYVDLSFQIIFPLAAHNQNIGALCLFSEKEIVFNQITVNLIKNLCATVAVTITNSRLYEEIRAHEKELEFEVARRTDELKTAMERAQDADRIKSAFLATMSHELRTPLNSIIGFTGIILQELPGPINEEQRKQMLMVQNSSRHLLALINDVLDISKIEAGELKLLITTFDVKTSIEKVVNMIMPQSEKKGLKLNIHIADDVGISKTDQRRLEQVILNLLNNAVKFTEQGSISLSCSTLDSNYILSVADTGIGITHENLSSIFQPFHQIDSGLSRNHEGTGLGLSICMKLLDLMGGSITAESRPDEGSTFKITFPGIDGVKI